MKFVLVFITLLTISSTSLAGAPAEGFNPNDKVRICGLIKQDNTNEYFKAIRHQGVLLKLNPIEVTTSDEEYEESYDIIDAVSVGQYLCMSGYIDRTGTYFSPVR
jgi:hypothetical protein